MFCLSATDRPLAENLETEMGKHVDDLRPFDMPYYSPYVRAARKVQKVRIR